MIGIVLRGVIERSYMTILFSDQRHIYINRQSYREAIDVGNKVIAQNNIQKISNIVILQRVLFIKLVS